MVSELCPEQLVLHLARMALLLFVNNGELIRMFSTRSHVWLLETCAKWLLLSPSHDHQNHIQTAASQHCSPGTCSGQALFSIAGHTAQTTQNSSRGEMWTLSLADGPRPGDTSSPSSSQWWQTSQVTIVLPPFPLQELRTGIWEKPTEAR